MMPLPIPKPPKPNRECQSSANRKKPSQIPIPTPRGNGVTEATLPDIRNPNPLRSVKSRDRSLIANPSPTKSQPGNGDIQHSEINCICAAWGGSVVPTPRVRREVLQRLARTRDAHADGVPRCVRREIDATEALNARATRQPDSVVGVDQAHIDARPRGALRVHVDAHRCCAGKIGRREHSATMASQGFGKFACKRHTATLVAWSWAWEHRPLAHRGAGAPHRPNRPCP